MVSFSPSGAPSTLYPFGATQIQNGAFQPQDKSDEAKRKYRLLSDFEKRGLAVEIQELKAQFERDKDPRTQVKLLEARLTEFQSSYQATKDAWKKTEHDLQGTQANLQAKEVQISFVQRELAQAQKDLEQTKKEKRRRDEDYEQLDRRDRSKAHKLDQAETNRQKLCSQLRSNESQIAAQQKQIEELQAQLHQERVLKAATVAQLALEQNKGEALQKNVGDLNSTLRGLLEGQMSQVSRIQDALRNIPSRNAIEPNIDFL